MLELKPLQDFFNPMQAGMQMMQMQQYQQHMQNQRDNMLADNARADANAKESSANSAAALEGYRTAAQAAGLPGDTNTAQAVAASGPAQGQIFGALADPVKQSQSTKLKAMNAEHAERVAGIHAQQQALVPISKSAQIGLEDSQPHMAVMAQIQGQYQRDVKNIGLTKAQAKRHETIKLHDDLSQFLDAGKAAIPQIQQQLQQLKAKRTDLQSQAELMATGAIPTPAGQNLSVFNGIIDASGYHLRLLENKLALAKDPSQANFDKLTQSTTDMQSHLNALQESKSASQANLDESMKEHGLTRQRTDNIGKAQVAWMEAGGNLKTAYRYAKQFGVKVDEVTDAAKDPNKALVQINNKQETAEDSQVGGDFGKQYGKMQEDSINAGGRLAKYGRMEQLLEGVSTGKLTPTITQVQAIADGLGLSVDKTLPAKQALEALASEVALSFRNPAGGEGMPGNLSNKDLDFLISMTPGLSKTREGNQLIIGTAKLLAQRQQEIAKMARAYRQKNGHFDDGFLDQLQAYSDKNPLFAGKSVPSTAPVASDLTFDADKEQRYQAWKAQQK